VFTHSVAFRHTHHMCYQDKTANPPVCTCLCDTGSSPSRPASPQGCVDRTSGSAPFLDFKDRDRAALPGYTTRPDRPCLSLPCRSQPLGAMELPRSDAYGTQGGARSWEGGARWVPGTWSAGRSVRGGGGGGRAGGGVLGKAISAALQGPAIQGAFARRLARGPAGRFIARMAHRVPLREGR
jgi:hypothetical protein